MRGRTRTIKPELFSDEQLGDLEEQTGLPIFRSFVGLLVFADREGRFRWAPRALKGAIAPCWSGDFGAVLEALESRGLITRCNVDGDKFGLIREDLIGVRMPESKRVVWRARQRLRRAARRLRPMSSADVCAYCGDRSAYMTIDHIVPICQGGTNAPGNLVPACQRCNSRKGGRTPEEAGMDSSS